MIVPVGAKIANVPSPLPEEKSVQFRHAFLCVAPSMFFGALDQTIIAAALPATAGSLGGLSYLAWIVTAYLLTATVAAPLYGRMGDAFGRKRMLIWALGIFVAGSAACSVSPKERGRFQGWFGANFALASTLGPVVGGILSQTLGWRRVFWVNVPLGLQLRVQRRSAAI